MQATVCSSSIRALAPRCSARSTHSARAAVPVVCRAQQSSAASKAAAAGVSIPALLAAHPALALVDDRLAGEGTGKIFGINDPALFWVLAGMFALIWSVYYVSQKDLGGDDGEDSGLTL